MSLLKLSNFIVLLSFSSIIHAQDISQSLLSTSGDTFKGAGYQLDWSIGEVQIESGLSGKVLLTQGFQQGSYLITLIDRVENPDLEILVYPNPVKDNIHLRISRVENIHFVLTGSNGCELIRNNDLKNEQDINMANLPNGIYILNICSNIQLVKAIKIVKLN